MLMMATGYDIRGIDSVTVVASFDKGKAGPATPLLGSTILPSRGSTLVRISSIHKLSGTTHCLLTSSRVGLDG